MAVHSNIGASSMYRWAKCPGSVKLSENIPRTSSAYAEQGTNAHTLASEILLNQPASVTISDEEEISAIQTYVDYVTERSRNNIYFIEQRFDLERLYPGLFGTSDAVIFDVKTLTLEVIDYKHGAGIAVDVKDNMQLKYYALGSLLQMDKACTSIKLTIVQPRCYHPDGSIRSDVISPEELLNFAGDLVHYARATAKEDAPLVSGDHCKFCPAAGICPKLSEEKDLILKDALNSITVYDMEKLEKALTIIPQIEAWIEGVKSFAYNEARRGTKIPGHKLVYKVARRKWSDEKLAIETLFGLGCTNEILNSSLKSPAQVEKILDKTAKEILQRLVIQESSGTVLVPEYDKRAEVSLDALPAQFLTVETE